jgi:hypothetical protein
MRKLITLGVVVLGTCSIVRAEEATTNPLPRFTLGNATTVLEKPLKRDGSPHYLQAINERYSKGVTPQNNAFVTYLEIVGTGTTTMSAQHRDQVLPMCGAQATKEGATVWERNKRFLMEGNDATTREAMKSAMQEPWQADDHPAVAEYLKERDKLLDHALVMAAREKWWVPYVAIDSQDMKNALLPSMTPARDMAEALCARAMLKAGNGDFDGFLRNVIAAKRLARHVGSGAMVPEWLIGTGMDRQANLTIAASAARWNEKQCLQLRQELADLPAMARVHELTDVWERWRTLETVMSLSKGLVVQRRNGINLKTIEQARVNYDAVLRLVNGILDELVAAMKEPSMADAAAKTEALALQMEQWAKEYGETNDRSLAPKEGENDADYSARVGRAIVVHFAPSMAGMHESNRRHMQQELMTDALLAAAAFRARTGDWPKTLDQLVPLHLKAPPRDLFAKDRAVKYVVGSEKVRIYSVGVNGVDDAGEDARGKDDVIVETKTAAKPAG